jgi:hypothetical protein
MLREICQTEKEKYCMFSLIWGIYIAKKEINDTSVKWGLFKGGHQQKGKDKRRGRQMNVTEVLHKHT